MTSHSDQPQETSAAMATKHAATSEQAAPNQFLLIDSRVPEPQAIIAAATPGATVVMVDASQDGVTQIARALEGQHDVASIGVVSHGDAGVLLLGATPVSAATLAAHRGDLQTIGAAMRADGDIQLYGCDVGAGDKGAQFVFALAQATGASVAASNNATGSGGDWQLEISSGNGHGAPALNARELAHYDHVLHTASVSTLAQLKAAIATASSDGSPDTITLLNNISFSTSFDAFSITVTDGQTLSIVGGGFTLNGNNRARVLDITAGKVAISNLTVSSGFVTGDGGAIGAYTTGAAGADALGAGIRNAGTLTITNSTIIASKAAGGGGGASQTAGGGGAGGGGGGFSTTFGGVGGANPPAAGGAASAGTGGTGAGFIASGTQFLGGKGGTTTGGAGGVYGGYTTGGNGGTANNGSISIGGGGGGAGYDRGGGRGGNAASGIYNTGTLTMTGSAITNNIGAGGGGGAGAAAASTNSGNGGNGGSGIGGIWNAGGLVQIDAATNATLATGNVGSGGGGGAATKAGSVNGTPGTGTAQILTTGGGTTVTNYDAIPPTATIAVTDTSLSVGETSTVTITFSEAVTGFTNGDLSVGNGTLTTVSTANNIVFTATLTPTAGVTAVTNVIALNNAGVTDTAGNAGVGTTNSNNYAIDTVRPTATVAVVDPSLTVGETSAVTITFNEAVNGFANADLTIANGTLSTLATSDNITFTATLTPNASVTAATNVIALNNSGFADLAGNTGTGTTNSNNYAIDNVRPTATVAVADTSLIAGETSTVTITFSEPVGGFTNADLTVANGTLSAVGTSDGMTFTATLTPTTGITAATNVITINNAGYADLAGNAGVGSSNSNNYAIDTVRPTATIVVADAALTLNETSLVTVTFSEAVIGFTNADLTIANGSLSTVSSSDGGITWTATLTPAPGVTDITNVIVLNNPGVSDLPGNAGTGTTTSNNYTVDTQATPDLIFWNGFESVSGLQAAHAVSNNASDIFAHSPTASDAQPASSAQSTLTTGATAGEGATLKTANAHNADAPTTATAAETTIIQQPQGGIAPTPIPLLSPETSALLGVLIACAAWRVIRVGQRLRN